MRIQILFLLAGAATARAQIIALDPATLKAHNVTAERATWKGRAAVRITDSGADSVPDGERLAIVPGIEFQDGTIEVDVTGDTKPGAPPTYRGFTGVAFRVSEDGAKYESFYLRPKNGRAEDQEQRNHAAQYISYPEFTWQRLRQETPSRYEAYTDLVPGEWTSVKIAVRGDKAKLYVQGTGQPALIVNDLKHGISKGAVALWLGPGTVAHFANLRVTKQ
jgi:hypothetical protein